MAKTALITKFTYTLLEEATSDNVARAVSRSCHCLIDICIISSRLYMPIPTVVSLAASTILEVSEIENTRLLSHEKYEEKSHGRERVRTTTLGHV